MAKRRMISQELVYDEEFNSLSVEGQLIFLRLLAVSDDCGVVPATTSTLLALINPPEKLRSKIGPVVSEIVTAGLGRIVTYASKPYFLFKPSAFNRHQSYIINKRKQSEYLKITATAFDEINWDATDSQLNVTCCASDIASRKQKAESSKQKEESRKQKETEEEKAIFGEFGNVHLSATEYEKLKERFGAMVANAGIENYSTAVKSKGLKYKDDYATICNWIRRDQERGKNGAGNGKGYQGRTRQSPTVDDLRESAAAVERMRGQKRPGE